MKTESETQEKILTSKESLFNDLMITQGIGLIEDGLRFLEFADTFSKGELVSDLLTILRNRFDVFKECAVSGKQDVHFIDKMISTNKFVLKENTSELNESLKKLREKALETRWKEKND